MDLKKTLYKERDPFLFAPQLILRTVWMVLLFRYVMNLSLLVWLDKTVTCGGAGMCGRRLLERGAGD